MSTPAHPLPSSAGLLKATGAAIAVASLILTTTVLPAEYGIDPTGIGRSLGLLTLAKSAQAAPAPAATPAPAAPAPQAGPAADSNAELAAQAAAVFGKQPGQAFNAQAVTRGADGVRTDTMTVTLAPGKGAELKAMLASGQSFVFQWTASAEVAVDMHGEVPGAKDAYTSYWIDGAQKQGSGTLTAPFAGQHGWYWLNKGTQPVTVQVTVTGFQTKLFRPGH